MSAKDFGPGAAARAGGAFGAPLPIAEIAAQAGLALEEIEPRGEFVAKIRLEAAVRNAARPSGRHVIVTAVTPTRHGEGKTTTVIGLVDGLRRRGRAAFACVRQPSLGPTLGMKGGGAGGGRSRVVPTEPVELHLTGDGHAVAAAHNLLAAAIDARLYHEKKRSDAELAQAELARLDMDPASIDWPRVLDVNDRALRHVRVGLDGGSLARDSRFEIAGASEVMAVLALAADLRDLRERLGRIVVARASSGLPVTAEMLGAGGAMAALLRDALMPNLMQSLEHSPVLVHAGPFANLSLGCSSVIADRLALGLAGPDGYVVTEAGFGADVGLEKFVHLKCRAGGFTPGCAVIVATVRALAAHGEGDSGGRCALDAGCDNLAWQVGIAHGFGLPAVVAVNRFPGDTDADLAVVLRRALDAGAVRAVVAEHFACGGEGAIALAEAVESAARPVAPRFLYDVSDPIPDKIEAIARAVYNADGLDWSEGALRALAAIERAGGAELPVCIAKTAYSIGHDPAARNVPSGYRVPVRALRGAFGAGHVVALLGDISAMPGLGPHPRFAGLDIDPVSGRIIGLD